MKPWIMTLPFVCVASVAMAQGVDDGAGGANATPELQLASATHAQAPSVSEPRRTAARGGKRGARSLPKGDVRHCLDFKTQVGVIRCSESGKTRKR
jgi:hypothetical protein